MSIPYECVECGAFLKIKDSLAGTKGKCPTCRAKFVVPQKGETSGDTSSPNLDPASPSVTVTSPSSSPTPAAPAPEARSPTKPAKTDAAPASSAPATSKESKAAPARPAEPAPAATGPASSPSLGADPPASSQKSNDASPPDEVSPVGEDEAAENGFDLDAFLSDESAPGAKASAGLASKPTPEAAASKPKYDKLGRRTFTPAPSPDAAAEPPPPEEGSSTATLSASSRSMLAKDGALGEAGGKRKFRLKINFKEAFATLRPKLGYIAAGILGITGAYLTSVYFMTPRLPLPILAPVSGKVTLNGKPIRNVIVNLSSTAAANGKSANGVPIRMRDASGITNEEGEFEIAYMEGTPGAPLGKSRVWVQPMNAADFKKLPPRYLSLGSGDIRDVKEVGNETRFNLDLKSP